MDDKVSVGVFKQVMWERDVALAQLEEIGKGLGAKMDDVRTVVRGKWKKIGPIDEGISSECFICSKISSWPSDFCPNCGADMREVDDGEQSY